MGTKAGGSVETLVLWCHQGQCLEGYLQWVKEAMKANAKWYGVTGKAVSAQGIFAYFILFPVNTSF